MKNFLNFLRSKFNDTLPASILPPDEEAFEKICEKFSMCPKNRKSFAIICMPKNCKMSVCPDFVALKCTKKIHKHQKHPKHTSKLIL